MEIKGIHMTDEYAANYFLSQGYLAARIEAIETEVKKLWEAQFDEENNGD